MLNVNGEYVPTVSDITRFIDSYRNPMLAGKTHPNYLTRFLVANWGLLSREIEYCPVSESGKILENRDAPAGIRTQVIAVRGQYDWPDYTTGAGVVYTQS